jgi:hypothetical protein
MRKTPSQAKKAFRLFKCLCLILLSSFLFQSCVVKVHPPPSTGPCTFTVSGIFATCHNPLSSTKPLTYSMVFIVYYYNGNDKLILNQQNISSSKTNPSSTVVISSELPKDGSTWSVEVTVTATQCSTCALTQYGASDICIQTQSPQGTTAARPVLHYWPIETVGYTSTRSIILNLSSRAENAANSCNCTVPN